MSDKDKKVKITVGCMDYLIGEVTKVRARLEVAQAENKIMHNFFSLVDRLGDKPSLAYGEDKFFYAKDEFTKALKDV